MRTIILQVFIRYSLKPTSENGLRAKSVNFTPQMDVPLFSTSIFVSEWAKFSMKFVFKSWFLGKIWLQQICNIFKSKYHLNLDNHNRCRSNTLSAKSG